MEAERWIVLLPTEEGGKRKEMRFRKTTCVFGSDPTCDVRLRREGAEGLHALLLCASPGAAVTLQRRSQTQPLLHNGRPLSPMESVSVSHGDTVGIAGRTFLFELRDPPPPPPALAEIAAADPQVLVPTQPAQRYAPGTAATAATAAAEISDEFASLPLIRDTAAVATVRGSTTETPVKTPVAADKEPGEDVVSHSSGEEDEEAEEKQQPPATSAAAPKEEEDEEELEEEEEEKPRRSTRIRGGSRSVAKRPRGSQQPPRRPSQKKRTKKEENERSAPAAPPEEEAGSGATDSEESDQETTKDLRLFKGHTFILSGLGREKASVAETIRRHGGTVFRNGFEHKPAVSQAVAVEPKKQLQLPATVVITGYDTDGTLLRTCTCLLAIVCHIPCLSVDWMRRSVAEQKLMPLRPYMLDVRPYNRHGSKTKKVSQHDLLLKSPDLSEILAGKRVKLDSASGSRDTAGSFGQWRWILEHLGASVVDFGKKTFDAWLCLPPPSSSSGSEHRASTRRATAAVLDTLDPEGGLKTRRSSKHRRAARERKSTSRAAAATTEHMRIDIRWASDCMILGKALEMEDYLLDSNSSDDDSDS